MSSVHKESCSASALIAALQAMIAKHGDLQVFTKDPDTYWRMPIGLVFRPPDDNREIPRFEIRTDYHSRPEGDLCAADWSAG